MNIFENTSLATLAQLSTLCSAVGVAFDHGVVEGTLSINDEILPVKGTYPEVNRSLRQIMATVKGTFEGDVTFALNVVDEFGNECDVAQTLNATNFTPTIGERTVAGEVLQVLSDRTIPCPLQILETFGTLSITDEAHVTAIKIEAGRRINALVPQWKQTNASTRMIELLEIGKDKWSATEKAEVEAIRQGFAAIKAVRTKSDEIEALTDIPLDVWNDEHWTS